ncbi:hypothetical protein DERF_011975 [Dermatophagoides farinae]|uniref:Uncharacterized protein n=1 Tax=Dermatophagoides farinae TaxID=6954 RepID=A0A922L319_DERFA|nr:hypothetical protein DERF_011975 [Dermatophagoides farinae]
MSQQLISETTENLKKEKKRKKNREQGSDEKKTDYLLDVVFILLIGRRCIRATCINIDQWSRSLFGHYYYSTILRMCCINQLSDCSP